MRGASFELLEPRTGETPVVVEVPHAGLWLDPESMALTTAPVDAIGRDADLYVDELAAEAPLEGASLLLSRLSRYVVDLNRSEGDYDGRAVVGASGEDHPCGLLWSTTSNGHPTLAAPVSRHELERRLNLAYRPYHAALDAVVERKRARFGLAVILSLHSMPSEGPDRGARRRIVRADVVTGTRRLSTSSPRFVAVSEQHARSFGWSVSHDDPYQGGATTVRLGRPSEGFHAVQVELARRLYMDERTLRKAQGGFELTRSFCRGLVAKLGAAALG